ncbi:MAG: hypothetical protein L6R39_000581 [Caloplaca ligustica]|nr:MAG: hypothetical protein L6R39_000581 [Caloplaca ligustica]
MAPQNSTQDPIITGLGHESYKDDAFPRVSTTETPELDHLSSTSESDIPQVSISKKGGTLSKARAKRVRKELQRSEAGHVPIASTPLRPAHDVLNRIRHDSHLQVSDYVVGYRDRHVGIMEKAVEDWSVEGVEEEEFIPLHRIVYIKRLSDDHIVWDREKRIDEVFGSGMSAERPTEDGS